MSASDAINRLLDAINSRDVRAMEGALRPDATWQNVPHPESVGRNAVIETLAPIVRWSDRVDWEVVSHQYADDVGWVERVDRFEIAGEEHAVCCNGVFTVAEGAVQSVRDYVDLGEWRERIVPVYESMANRTPAEVVARHLAAVSRRDSVAMAADYALDAEVDRAGAVHRGHRAIADYFDTVAGRLGDRVLSLGAPVSIGGHGVVVEWTVDGGDAPAVAGRDHYEIDGGWISRQTVSLDRGTDF